jgi:hypothetical protein
MSIFAESLEWARRSATVVGLRQVREVIRLGLQCHRTVGDLPVKSNSEQPRPIADGLNAGRGHWTRPSIAVGAVANGIGPQSWRFRFIKQLIYIEFL